MSVIKLKCVEQTLTIVNAPEISSGNVNYDTINFEFCSSWSGFTKTAIFYRKKAEPYYKVLDSSNNCTIPKEVLTDRGLIFIGVFGTKGDVVLTSGVVPYMVNEGAITEGLKPSDPTPDIYEQILAEFGDVRDVYEDFKKTLVELDNTIVVTSDKTLANSKAGGLKLNYVKGKSVQNGTPTPDNPISIENVADSVKIIRGGYYDTNGNYVSTSQGICNKTPIPCASGDIIKITPETTNFTNIRLIFYNGDTFLSAINGGTTTNTFTVPTNATRFNFTIQNDSGITVDTVGKITLTINGKYVLQKRAENKNVFKSTSPTKRTDSATYENNNDGTWTITCNGGAGGYYKIGEVTAKGKVTLSGCEHGSSKTYVIQYWDESNSRTIHNLYTGRYVANLDTETRIGVYIGIVSGSTVNATVSPMIQLGNVENITFEQYKETVATVLLNEPLRDSDVTSRTEVNRKFASVIFDGSDDENFTLNASIPNAFSILPNGMKKGAKVLCTHYKQYSSVAGVSFGMTAGTYLNFINANCSTVAEFKATLQSNPIEVVYELAEPIIEVLDSASQIALNSLETFDEVTYLSVDSRVEPDIEVEYGVTRDSGYTLKSLLNSETNAIRIADVTTALLELNQV